MTDNQIKEMFGLMTKSVNGVQRLEERVGRIETKVDKIDEDVSVIKEDVAILKVDVAVLKEDVIILKENVSLLKGDVDGIKTGQLKIEKEVHLNSFAINEALGEQLRLRIRVDVLENAPA